MVKKLMVVGIVELHESPDVGFGGVGFRGDPLDLSQLIAREFLGEEIHVNTTEVGMCKITVERI